MNRRRLALLIACAIWIAQPGAARKTANAQAVDGHTESGTLNRALGVDCAFCHGETRDTPPPAHAVARRMMTMVSEINARLKTKGGGYITCWTCHAGARTPSRLDRSRVETLLSSWPADASAAPMSVKETMAVYSASTGRTCLGCHEPEDKWRATKEVEEAVTLMNGLLSIARTHVPTGAELSCFTCHKRRPHPAAAPRD